MSRNAQEANGSLSPASPVLPDDSYGQSGQSDTFGSGSEYRPAVVDRVGRQLVDSNAGPPFLAQVTTLAAEAALVATTLVATVSGPSR